MHCLLVHGLVERGPLEKFRIENIANKVAEWGSTQGHKICLIVSMKNNCFLSSIGILGCSSAQVIAKLILGYF